MGFDTKMLGEPQGQIKVGSAVCALIAFIFTIMGDVCKPCKFGWTDEVLLVFYWSLVTCMTISICLVIAGLFGIENDIVTAVDKIFHILGSILMVVITTMFLVRVWYRWAWTYWKCCGAFSAFYAILLAAYGYMAAQGS